MKKRICIVCFCVLLFFTGCKSTENTELTEKNTATQEETNGTDTEDKDVSEEEKWNAPINYTWNPHVYGDILKELYGEKSEEEFYGLVDAVLAREESCPFDTENSQFMYDICFIVKQAFPIFEKLVADYRFEEGKAYFEYCYDITQHEAYIKEFKEKIEEIICSSVTETDNQTMAALAIYHFFSERITYDDEGVGDFGVDITPYRALMEYEGICQSFASAYVYLLLQCNIPAVNISGYNDDAAHEWTLVKLKGKYYHMDPTFEEGWGGNGLSFFGMTNERREFHDFPVDGFNVMNIWWGSDIQAEDESFAELWNIKEVYGILRDKSGMTIFGMGDVYGADEEISVLIPY